MNETTNRAPLTDRLRGLAANLRGAFALGSETADEGANTIDALTAERDARLAAAWVAGRDAAAAETERGADIAPLRDSGMMQALADNIRQLDPPPGLAADMLDDLTAERDALRAVRDAADKLVNHPGWGTVNYTDGRMWDDGEALRAALAHVTETQKS